MNIPWVFHPEYFQLWIIEMMCLSKADQIVFYIHVRDNAVCSASTTPISFLWVMFSNPESPWCHSQFQHRRLGWEWARTSFRCVLALQNSDLFLRTTVPNIMKMKCYKDSQEILLLGGWPRYWWFFYFSVFPKT